MGIVKELQDNLLKELGLRAPTHGFKPVVSEQIFWKPTDFGRHILHIAFIRHPPEVDAMAEVAIRVDAVEDLVHAQSDLKPREKRRTATIGAELGNIKKGRNILWSLEGIPQTGEVAESIWDAYVKIGAPFLERYSSLETLYRELTSGGPHTWARLLGPIDYVRAMKCVALGHVLGKTEEELNQVIEIQRRVLVERKEFGLDGYDRFVDYLRSIRGSQR